LKRGFTLIEVLVALLVFIVGVGSIFYVFSRFSDLMKNRFEITCVTQAAYYALDACEAGASPPADFVCGNITVNVSASGCEPSTGACRDISVTASYNSISFSLSSKKCDPGASS